MPRKRINQITIWILLVGLGTALAIYFAAAPEPADSYWGDPLASKKYLRQMEMIGGKANVLASDFQDWFAGLWKGRGLAGTVAFLTAGAALVFRFVATHPDYRKYGAPDDEGPGKRH